MKKLIITDVDGVMLDWHNTFIFYMVEKGYDIIKDKNKIYNDAKEFELTQQKYSINENVREFNRSFLFSELPPLRDSFQYIRKFYENHGIQFLCVTSCGNTYDTKKARRINIERVFGNSIFDIQFLNIGESKYLSLKKIKEFYDPICWIEDKMQNAEHGFLCGMRSYFMKHDYNRNFVSKLDIQVVSSWKTIYEDLQEFGYLE